MESDPIFAACVAVAGGPDAPFADLDPQALIDALARHKLVARSERVAARMTWAQREALRPWWREGAARSLAHLAALHKVIDALGRAGLPAIGVKGVVLQRALHGTPIGRDQVDLDVLVPDGRLRQAVVALQANGWALSVSITATRMEGPLPSELPLHDPGTGVQLDVHQRLFAHHYALDGAERALRARVGADGLDLLGTALYVGLSGGKDVWSTLRHVADLGDLADRADLQALAALGDRTHTRGILDVGFGLAERVLDRSLGWSARTRCVRVVPELLERLRDGPTNDRPTAARLRLWLTARERRRDRLLGLARLPFAVGAMDLTGDGAAPHALRRTARLLRTYVRGEPAQV